MTDQTVVENDDQREENTDFDAWRETQQAKRGNGRMIRIFGRDVVLRTTLPLGLAIELEEAATTSVEDLDDVRRIVGEIFGADALDHWIEAGADIEDLQVLMTFGIAYASGQRDITFAQAAQLMADFQAKKAGGQGKAPKKTKRRKGPGGGSPATGH